MKNKTREWICFGSVATATTLIVWVFLKSVLGDDHWVYDHITLICVAGAVASGLVAVGITAMWNHSTAKTVAATALVAATLTSAQAGIFTPATGDSPNSSPKGSYWSWLFHGWDFGWGFWRDGLDSWQSGHPVITIDPQPPSNSDTSGK